MEMKEEDDTFQCFLFLTKQTKSKYFTSDLTTASVEFELDTLSDSVLGRTIFNYNISWSRNGLLFPTVCWCVFLTIII